MRLRIACAVVLYGALALIVWALYIDWFAALLALTGTFGGVTAALAYKGIHEAARDVQPANTLSGKKESIS